MGFFDLLSPVFLEIDNSVTTFISPFFRLLVWGVLSAGISISLFRKLLNEKKASQLKVEIKELQEQLNKHEGEFSELKDIAKKTIYKSISRVFVMFFPALIASLPLVFIMSYLSNNYSLESPKPNDIITFNATPNFNSDKGGFYWKAQENEVLNLELNKLYWPDLNKTISLIEAKESLTIFSAPFPLSTVLHKKQWWNQLFGNPAGYLSEDGSVDFIEFDFIKKKFELPIIKTKLTWEWIYFSFVFLFSIVLMFFYKKHQP